MLAISELARSETWLIELISASPMVAITIITVYLLFRSKLGSNGDSVKECVHDLRESIIRFEERFNVFEEELKKERDLLRELEIQVARLDQHLDSHDHRLEDHDRRFHHNTG